jgi:cysteine desulfurase/selenocysteine lyase
MLDYRSLFVGMEVMTPVLGGNPRHYINLDNAASTPPLRRVQDAIQRFSELYSSVHRGTGFKSQVCTHVYEAARRKVIAFVGADHQEHVCIFGKNTTEAVNKLARRFPFKPGKDIVLVSAMEHHSNDLPWRAAAEVVHIHVLADGQLDEAHFDQLLKQYGDRIALVAITAASNVTGCLNPLRRLAQKAHTAGAQIAVDCAQFAPHRKVDLPLRDPEHLDYVSISAHKMYAPYGTGALIGRRDTFEQGEPEYRGGGEVNIVTLDRVEWAEPPERDEAGSPNTPGAVALAAAITQLEEIGMQTVAAHETELTAYALRQMIDLPGLRVYGDSDPARASQRLGVIPFNLEGIPHPKVAAVLGYEFAIGVRHGCFCAHPYILHLMEVTPDHAHQVRRSILHNDRRAVPGMVRMSFGLYNSTQDVDALVDALQHIRRGEYIGDYRQDTTSGEYHPTGWDVDYDSYFKF